MTKKLINNIEEYRKWAWNISENFGEKVDERLGLLRSGDCYDYNEKDEPIDENGNVIPDDTCETVELDKWVEELNFPVIAVYWIDKEFDRGGEVCIIAVDFVEKKDFNE